MQIVLFLGAGFSRAWDFPTMEEFSRHVKNLGDATTDDNKLVDALVRGARQIASMIDISDKNLEELLSVYLADSPLGAKVPSPLLALLNKVFARQPDEKFYFLAREKLAPKIPKTLFPIHDLTIITTNYDLCIEQAFPHIGVSVALPCQIAEINPESTGHFLYSQKSKSTAVLCKLHGSVSWYETNKGIVVDNVVHTFQKNGTSTYLVPRACHSPQAETPLIVPPTFLGKSSREKCIEDAWRAAADALKKATIVTFVGYSFPDSDRHMAYFLAKCLSENADIEAVRIIDPRADAIAKRLQEGSFGPQFKSKLRPLKDTWQVDGWTFGG